MTVHEQYQFENVNHALQWSTEVLRARRFPKIAAFYLEAARGENGIAAEFAGWRTNLPRNREDQFNLAMQVVNSSVRELDAQQQQLLALHYWGDFADDGRYRKAVAFQERMRREGKRVRLSYRYSFRQLGLLLGISDKTAAQRVRQAQAQVTNVLKAQQLLEADV